MKKNSMLRTVLLSTVFALLAVFLLTPVAGAHTTAPTHRAAAATSQVPHIPNVDIIGNSFSQSTVHCIAADNPCFKITNKSKDDQGIFNDGKTIATLRPGQVERISVESGPGTYLVTLASNQDAMLFIIAS